MNPGPMSAARRALAVAVLLMLSVGLLTSALTPRAEAQTVTLNWVVWTPPATYPNTGTTPSAYTYAPSAVGELQLPNGPLVYVRLTGEIVNPALGTATETCTSYCGPSGFTLSTPPGAPPTTRPDYWQTYPFAGGGLSGTATGAGTAFTSVNVPFSQLPPNGDHIGLVGSSAGGNPTQTLEFFSDAARTTRVAVRDIVMVVGSLGALNAPIDAVWDFTQDFDILSTNTDDVGAAAHLNRSVKSPGGTGADFQLSGREGTGTIQFVGSFTSISWTVSAPEVWASWNISASSVPTARAAAQAAEATPAPTLALDCTPDPVQPGATVSCEVSGGDAGIDILWRASIDAPFAEQGITLDARGRGTFTFRAPPGASGRLIDIDLVDWGVTDTVAVNGPAVPSSVPAGGGPGVQMELVALTALALGVLMARSGSTAPLPGRSHVSRRTRARPVGARPRGPSTR